MITEAEIAYFETYGFLQCKQFLTVQEVGELTERFDEAMRKARDNAEEPELVQDERGYSRIRQQVNSDDKMKTPFFDYDPDAFYWMLDDPRFEDYFCHLLGDDYLVGGSEGIIHAGGTAWHNDHNDDKFPDEFFSMRAHMYLDHLDPENGCLTVIPGSHHAGGYRERLKANVRTANETGFQAQFGADAENLPGAMPIVNDPGDVIFLNHKTFHASLSGHRKRRCIHINVYKPARTNSVPALVEALAPHLKTEAYEMHHTAAKALRRLGTPEALAFVAGYDSGGPERNSPRSAALLY